MKRGGFYGNIWGYHDVTDPSDAAMKQPVCWITNAFDRSPVGVALGRRATAGGRCKGSLLNFSYGYGKIFVVPHEKVGGQMQGGMCALPMPQFPTGVMRGRFHPGQRPALRLRHVRLGRRPDAARRLLPRPRHRQADLRADRPERPQGRHGDHLQRPARPRRRPAIRTRYDGQDLVAEADRQLRLGALRRAAGADRGRDALGRRPDGLARDPRHAADLVHGDHLRDQGAERASPSRARSTTRSTNWAIDEREVPCNPPTTANCAHDVVPDRSRWSTTRRS